MTTAHGLGDRAGRFCEPFPALAVARHLRGSEIARFATPDSPIEFAIVYDWDHRSTIILCATASNSTE